MVDINMQKFQIGNLFCNKNFKILKIIMMTMN